MSVVCRVGLSCCCESCEICTCRRDIPTINLNILRCARSKLDSSSFVNVQLAQPSSTVAVTTASKSR
eukprot:7722115-Karenia_brevis.AAC.1